MDEKFTKPYNPQATEKRIYEIWEQGGFFNPDNLPGKRPKTFSIVLPPPNVTGRLHIGHASMLAIEDIMVRYKRMQGFSTLWLPGTDHAAIATQSKVEKLIEKEGLKKPELGREKFLARVTAFAQESHDTIVGQVKAMGSSLDWSREAYTLDSQRELAVKTAFIKMYQDGLIYRGERIVNWDPKGQTVISDDEIVYEEEKTILYTFKYTSDFPFAISTTRPETKLADTGVAVHPDDKRYQKFIGQEFAVKFYDRDLKLKVVADEGVDPEFGTGAVGLTPAHSLFDFELAKKNNLDIIEVIDQYGRIDGKKITMVREDIVTWLKDQNLLLSEEEITHNIARAERTAGVIEPRIMKQWFIDVNKEVGGKTLKERMRDAVESGSINILPERFAKIYFHWIDNLRDWCISRQIWYGHRIPVWYKDQEIFIGPEAPKDSGWTQDPDTLDTWFSSGLWTFSTLGWPEATADLKKFHPTSVLETGYDILFFWVARMILMSTYLLGEVPFKTVYLHGLVRDDKGRKMSKSLGNIVDPLEMIAKYGADATRMSLIIGTGPGNDSRLAENKIKGYKNFANKIWNITRFILDNTKDIKPDESQITEATDQELIAELAKIIKDITSDLEEFHFYLAAEKIYHYVWHRLADVILEESKQIINEGGVEVKISRQQTLLKLLKNNIIVLHPFMPFVTEEIWSHLPNKGENLLIVEPWPLS